MVIQTLALTGPLPSRRYKQSHCCRESGRGRGSWVEGKGEGELSVVPQCSIKKDSELRGKTDGQPTTPTPCRLYYSLVEALRSVSGDRGRGTEALEEGGPVRCSC